MIPIFETKRLTLRPVTLDDAPATQRLFPHWEIVRNLGHNIPWPYPEDGALQFYRDVALPAMERGEQWLWATDFWFNGLGRDKLRVAKAVGNIASRRITEKEGSRLVGIEDRVFRMGATQAEIWEITKEEWNARRRSAPDLRLSMSA